MLAVNINSYVTVDEADAYLAGEAGAERWSALTTEQKERFLITAARRIDSQILRGRKSDPAQAMAFPREFGYTEYPLSMVEVKYAQILEAFALSDAPATERRRLQEQGIQSISVGSASESYTDSAMSTAGNRLESAAAVRLLRSYLLGSVEIL